ISCGDQNRLLDRTARLRLCVSMNAFLPFRFRWARRASSAGLACSLGLVASLATAAVTQPDGEVMPKPNPSDEVGLQELFDFKEGPMVLDSIADASTEPATFKPLCDFSA